MNNWFCMYISQFKAFILSISIFSLQGIRIQWHAYRYKFASKQPVRQAGGRSVVGVSQSTADGNRNGNGNVNILATTRGIGLSRPCSPSNSTTVSCSSSVFTPAIGQFYFCLSLAVALQLILLILLIYISYFPFSISHLPISQANVVRGNKNKSKCTGDRRLQGDRLSDRCRDGATEIYVYMYIQRERTNSVLLWSLQTSMPNTTYMYTSTGCLTTFASHIYC